jgi:hypothetical protein
MKQRCVCHLLTVTLFKCFVTYVSFQSARFEQQRAQHPELLLPPAGSCNAAAVHTLAAAAAALKQLRD